jgi:asparagine synthase (glutamine-hydrolysing)
MCGIAGSFEYAGRGRIDPHVLERMLDVIWHRGPDDCGTHIDDRTGIGTRRLSIIDLESGHQPMANEDGSVVVVNNGEIYNYRALAAGLRSRGHTVATASDTETIVHLYEERGDEFVQELRGMFAAAVWDARRKRLVLARDRLGIKPLYYADTGDRLVFGSEIKAILQHPAVEVRPSLSALGHFLALKYVPAPETMFEGIHALPPGHRLTCDADGVRVERYWDLSFDRDRADVFSEEEAAERLEELLKDAVRSHLVSDVPFGAFLSGGVDSSMVVALMSQLLDSPVQTFAVGFEGAGRIVSELPYARMVAERWETDHHEVLIGANDFVDRLESVVWHLDQPIADEASLPNYMVSELAARHVKMILSGEGGDELFAGYARYSFERLASVFGAIPGPMRRLAVSTAGRLPRMRRAKIALRALCERDEARRMTTWFPLFNEQQLAELITVDTEAALDGPAADVLAKTLRHADGADAISRMLYVDTKLWLADDLLARGDKTSMAASLEARVPLLDYPLVEFAASLPPSLKLRGKTRKYLLRKVAAKWLPAEILTRKKEGFPTPVSVWFRGEARDFLREHLTPETIDRRGLFDGAYVARLIDEHERGFADHGSLLYGLLTVELWHRCYADGNVRQRAAQRRLDGRAAIAAVGGHS